MWKYSMPKLREVIGKTKTQIYCQELYVGDGTAVAQWSRYCATNKKVAGSIPDGAIGIFH
jgi:hypothetical protein